MAQHPSVTTFLFASRRRHTRYIGDWSSDVCSSDLDHGRSAPSEVYCGKGALIFPMVQTCRDLSLELMSFDVAPQQSLYTKQGDRKSGVKGKSTDLGERVGKEASVTQARTPTHSSVT